MTETGQAQPDPADPLRRRRRRRLLVDIGWATAVGITVATGFVWAAIAVSFQLFGEAADREDHLVAAGCYVGTAAVLALGVVALVAYHGPRWLVPIASTVAALDLMLALGARADAAAAEDRGPGINTVWDGVGGVLAAPWTWPLVVLGLAGSVRLARRAASRRVRARGAPRAR